MASTSNIVDDLELTLSCKPSWVPKSINNLLTDVAQMNSASAKLLKLEIHLQKHVDELHGIQTSKDHDLPHCMLLLKDAIEVIQEQISIIKNGNIEADHRVAPLIWEKQNQSEKPSFPPPKHGIFSIPSIRPNKRNKKEEPESTSKNPMSNFNINDSDCSITSTPIANNRASPLPIEKNGRRIWTTELNLRFMKAITDLGGAEAATPKRVKDKMHVDRLTNDQVKSHLQKLRIFKRAGLPVPRAGAGSTSADSLHDHQPIAMAQQQNRSLHQSQVPYTRDFLGVTSVAAAQDWK